jgi:hypothetical protein
MKAGWVLMAIAPHMQIELFVFQTSGLDEHMIVCAESWA